jgi:hypothetical protein
MHEDLRGKRFGLLIAMEYMKADKYGSAMWKCQCDCGNKTVTVAGALKTGNTKSCGCQTKIRKHGLWKHPLYGVWQGMKTRCTNPNSNRYQYYGGKGVTVCEEWLNFKTFYDWSIANGYQQGLSLDRKERNKGYFPDNCRWSSIKEQNNNKTDNVMVYHEGSKYTVNEFSQLTGISKGILYRKLERYQDN